MKEKKLTSLIILNEALADPTDISSSPSAQYLIRKLGSDELRFVMRGETPPEHFNIFKNDENFSIVLKKILFDKNYREQLLLTFDNLKVYLKNCDKVWIRLPSGLSFICMIILQRELKKRKVAIHICAQRLTLRRLLERGTLNYFMRWLLGLIITIYLFIFWRNSADFYYTGNHVRRAFFLPWRSQYLIDAILERSNTKKHLNGEILKVAYFGRCEKISPKSFALFKERFPEAVLSLYGPKPPLHPELNLHYVGYVSPDNVVDEMRAFDAIFACSDEYYEGFPRTVAQAICSGKSIILNRDACFFEDVKSYDRLILIDDKDHENVTKKPDLCDEIQSATNLHF